MSAVVAPRVMTGAEFLALPDDASVRRELIRGELREEQRELRNHRHAVVEANVARLIGVWNQTRPKPRGRVVSGEAGFHLAETPDSYVGIDVAYMTPTQCDLTTESQAYPEGPPLLAVEIVSPSDTHESVSDKIDLYLEAGVALVWSVDPRFRTVQVFRRDAEPVLFNVEDEIDAEPHMPGFRVPVARFFEL